MWWDEDKNQYFQTILAPNTATLHAGRVAINRSTLMFIVTLTLAAAVLWWVIFRVDHQSTIGSQREGWQDADEPPFVEVVPDPWLVLPDPWADAALPIATSIGPAMAEGTEVFAIADGVVVFSGIRGGLHAVILGHRSGGGERFESIYAPLVNVTCKPGELVGRGMVVGRVGEDALGPVVRELPAGIEMVGAGKSSLAEALEAISGEAWMSLEIGNAEKILELMDEPQE